MSEHGARTWYFPDAYHPALGGTDNTSYEAINIINVTFNDAELHFDFYFDDRDPIEDIQVEVAAKRCRHIRLDVPEQIGGTELPADTPYGIRIRSNTPIVAQYTRSLVPTQPTALMTTIGYPVFDDGDDDQMV